MSDIRWKKGHVGRYMSLTAVLPNKEEWTFSRPGGGHIYCDKGQARNTGILGAQICYGGGFRGDTISASNDEEFEREVKAWMRHFWAEH